MYKTSADLKREAKEMLRGRWKDAILLNLVPSVIQILIAIGTFVLIGMSFLAMMFFFSTFTSSTGNDPFSGNSIDNSFINELENLDELDDFDLSQFENNNSNFNDVLSDNGVNYNVGFSMGETIFSGAISVLLGFLFIGISYTFLDVLRNPMRKINPSSDAFRVFNGKDFVPLFLTLLLSYVFTWLWSLLLIIPGIVKGYSYSQATFIYKDLSTHESTEKLSANTYITESRMLMNGHKGRLFYIDLSFIGWHILAMMSFGIGYLWLNPYINSTKAAFYNNLSQDRYLNAVTEESVVIEGEDLDDEWTNF